MEYSLHFRLGFFPPCLILDAHIPVASSSMSDRFFLKQLKPESGNQHSGLVFFFFPPVSFIYLSRLEEFCV